MANKKKKKKQEKLPPPAETVGDFPVLDPAQLPYQGTSKRTRQIHQPVDHKKFFVDHLAIRATQYEFYFPIAVWHLQATRDFIDQLRQFAGGATVFKGATGVWREEKKGKLGEPVSGEEVTEDVYVYRMIINAQEFNPDANRPGLHSLVADYMADLAMCHFIQQREVLFTEQQVTLDRSFLRFEDEPKNPALN